MAAGCLKDFHAPESPLLKDTTRSFIWRLTSTRVSEGHLPYPKLSFIGGLKANSDPPASTSMYKVTITLRRASAYANSYEHTGKSNIIGCSQTT